MSARPIVHVLDPVHPDAIEHLREAVDVRMPGEGDWRIDADAVIVRNSTVGADDIRAARRLKVIGKHGAGTDNIDAEAARERGVEVHATPGVNAASVADLAVGFALSLLRDISGHSSALKAGAPLSGSARVGLELSEARVGILGLGAIGHAVARRLGAFGCKMTGYDPHLPAAAWPRAVERSDDLGAVLEQSRLVFLHMPLTPGTRHLLDEAMLQRMPRGAYLVNCARGGIVDEAALARLLASGHLAGAASDVFEVEPPARDNPLLALPNFLATPHLGASTNAGLSRVGTTIAAKVIERLAASAAADNSA